MQYRLSLIDALSGPAKVAGAAGAALAGSLKAVGSASESADSATNANAVSIRKMHTELGKAEGEVKGLESAQKRLAVSGSVDITQWRMLQTEIDKAKQKVSTINQAIVQAGGAGFDTKEFDKAEKAREDKEKKANKKAIDEKKKAAAEKKKAADEAEKRSQTNRDAQTNLLMGGAKAALAGVGAASAVAVLKLGLGYQGVARLAGITARAQHNFRGLFRGTDSKPMLDSLDRMVGMLSPATNTGKALGSILRGSFNALGKAIEAVTPFAERMFAGMILGANAGRLALTYVSAKVIGLIASIPGAAALVSKFGTGWTPFATGALIAGAALGIVAVKAALAMAPIIALGAAIAVVTSGIKDLSEAWTEWKALEADQAQAKKTTGVREIMPMTPPKGGTAGGAPTPPTNPAGSKAAGENVGKQLGAGMVAGMGTMMPEVKASGAALSSAAEEGAIARAMIHSPSEAMKRRVGFQLGAGVVVGIRAKGPEVQAAAEDALVPDLSAGVSMGVQAAFKPTSGQSGGVMPRGSNGGSEGRTLILDCRGANFYGIDGAGGLIRVVKAALADEIADVREQVGALAEA